jgi:putative oxidoreductase
MPGGAARATPYAIALLRIVTGLLVASHGVQQLITGPAKAVGALVSGVSKSGPASPTVLAWLLVVGQLCGLPLAIGLGTRVAAAVVGLSMAAVLWLGHRGGLGKIGTAAGIGAEYALVMALLGLFFVAVGPSVWSFGFRRGGGGGGKGGGASYRPTH